MTIGPEQSLGGIDEHFTTQHFFALRCQTLPLSLPDTVVTARQSIASLGPRMREMRDENSRDRL